MNRDRICLRCGEELKFKTEGYGVDLHHIMKLNSSVSVIPDEQRADYIKSFLLKQTNSSEEVITEYVMHYMGLCAVKQRNCPECGFTLKTWRAKLCFECGAEFEPWLLHE